MTVNEFVDTYNGKKVDYDGRFGYQCVDLFRQYCKDVWQIPHTGGVVGAAELFTKYDKMPLEVKYLDRLVYTGDMPETGDVVLFAPTKKNQYGHVAIVITASSQSMAVFEQDGFAQTGAYIKERGYGNVLGFLRKKKA